MQDKNSILRNLPKVDYLINAINGKYPDWNIPRNVLVQSIREVLEDARKRIMQSVEVSFAYDEDTILEWVKSRADKNFLPSLIKVVNGTGVVIHTNLGRSPLSENAANAVKEVSMSYSNLEYDLDEGKRGTRQSHAVKLLQLLTGAESAMVVNNDAAALFLTLNTLASGKEIIVSRGELIEIGDSFRIPEIIEKSGTIMREIGTTNKTKLSDYEKAITENTSLILKVHPSNYRIMGFTEEASLKELKELSERASIPLVYDLGSGLMLDMLEMDMDFEPTVPRSVKLGCDLVLFSGDKLLGGPQAGIIIGKSIYIETIRVNPLARVVRMDKMNFAALEATLRSYFDDEGVKDEIPTLSMISKSAKSLKEESEKLYGIIKESVDHTWELSIEKGESRIGGGSFPLYSLPTHMLSIKPSGISLESLERAMRRNNPPIITRVFDDKLYIDPRTLLSGDIDIIRDFFTGSNFKNPD